MNTICSLPEPMSADHGNVASGGARRAVLMVCALLLCHGASAQTIIEEIVVTAQKREQHLQDIPISISAFTGEQLQQLGVSRPSDLAAHIPGLNIKSGVSDQNPIITIRGVGLNNLDSNQNSRLAMYLDEVYIPYTPMMTFHLFDIERIELLRGPQGTLYGRNATAGTANLISRKPTQEFDAFTRFEYGSFSRFEFEGAAGGGLTDTLSARAALFTRQRGSGYQRNRVTGEDVGEQDRLYGRISLDWAPTENLNTLLVVHGGRDDSDWVQYDRISTADPVTFGTCQPFLEGRKSEGECIDFFGYFDPDDDIDTADVLTGHTGDGASVPAIDAQGWGVSFRIDWDLPRFTVTSVTGYDMYNKKHEDDFDMSPFSQVENFYHDEIDAVSQEVRLTSDDSWPVDWILGVFYGWDKIVFSQDPITLDFLGTELFVGGPQETEVIAVFGNVEKRFTEQWSIAVGLRYSDEERDFDQTTGDKNPFGTSLFFGPPPNPPGVISVLSHLEDEITTDDLSATVSLNWTPAADLLFYAKFSKSYNSGGVQGAFAATDAELGTFTKEEVYAYEGGFKTTLLEGTLRFNGALYYYDWKDLQAFVASISGGLPVLSMSNAGDADIVGFEADALWQPAESFLLGLGMNWMDHELDSDDPTLDGNDLANSPNFTFNGLARYTHPLNATVFGGLDLVTQLDWSWQDDVEFTTENTSAHTEDAYWLVNARISLITVNDEWDLSVFGRNLANERVKTEGCCAGGLGFAVALYNEPRTWGVSLTKRW
jgi:iron complex outermembrane receptor protein